MAEPETVEELCAYIVRYADSIFLRREKHGKWGNAALSKLSTMDALKTALDWVAEGRIPVRVLSAEEVEQRKRTAAEEGESHA